MRCFTACGLLALAFICTNTCAAQTTGGGGGIPGEGIRGAEIGHNTSGIYNVWGNEIRAKPVLPLNNDGTDQKTIEHTYEVIQKDCDLETRGPRNLDPTRDFRVRVGGGATAVILPGPHTIGMLSDSFSSNGGTNINLFKNEIAVESKTGTEEWRVDHTFNSDLGDRPSIDLGYEIINVERNHLGKLVRTDYRIRVTWQTPIPEISFQDREIDGFTQNHRFRYKIFKVSRTNAQQSAGKTINIEHPWRSGELYVNQSYSIAHIADMTPKEQELSLFAHFLIKRQNTTDVQNLTGFTNDHASLDGTRRSLSPPMTQLCDVVFD